jgi:uncharacterized SAM-dependent methyltransferase
MTSPVTVTILPSQFPDRVRRDLIESLRARRVNHKFHYDSLKQTQKWLALHAAYAPSRNDADCAAIYDRAFAAAARRIETPAVQLIGLGCGGGQKDTRLLALLSEQGKTVDYTPVDVSVAMVLTARASVLATLPGTACHPVVCDLATEENPRELLVSSVDADSIRIFTFFGMIPNFEPRAIMPGLAGLLRREDLLLFSANLAPGLDYAAGLAHVLPQYDNELTRDWLLTFLTDLGIERDDGVLRIRVEDGELGLKRIAADFQFSRARRISVDDQLIEFKPDDTVRLFFSYRYNIRSVEILLGEHGFTVLEQWMTTSQEEGVFLCRKE